MKKFLVGPVLVGTFAILFGILTMVFFVTTLAKVDTEYAKYGSLAVSAVIVAGVGGITTVVCIIVAGVSAIRNSVRGYRKGV